MTPSKFLFVTPFAISITLLCNGCSENSTTQQAAELPQQAAESVGEEVAAEAESAVMDSPPASPNLPEVLIISGVEQAQALLEAENWWGEESREQQPGVPRLFITSISPTWQETSRTMPVTTKKEFFYRFILPLVLHANEMIRDRRSRLEDFREQLQAGNMLVDEDFDWLTEVAGVLRLLPGTPRETLVNDQGAQISLVEDILYHLDEIPPGLALGQAAYESGYGTSRFAAQGNALFGQWTFDGSGIAPEEQRTELGDYGIASFEWPFDSVRSYVINLSRHAAYEEFRRLRAEMRAEGAPLDSIALAAGLVNYSERGQEYVDTLRSIIRVNKLAIADAAVFRDEPLRFIVGAQDDEDALRLEAELATMRENGEMAAILERMQLD